jgi:hypothetical protein
MMDRIINFELISNPINWIIVSLMLAIAVFGLNLVLSQDAPLLHATGSTGL